MSFADFVGQLEALSANESQGAPGPATTASVATATATATATPVATPVATAKPKPFTFLLIGTHIQQTTGYSKVCYGMIRELAKHPWIRVIHFAIQGNHALQLPRTYPPNVIVYDAVAGETPKDQGFGYKQIASLVAKETPDVVCIYNDIHITTKYLHELVPLKKTQTFQLWSYLDQVYESQPTEHLESLCQDVDRILCFTNEWRDVLKRQGVTRPMDVLNHGFDPTLFPNLSREEAREKMNIPLDTFLFVSLNRNQPRKRYDLLIMAFVDLIVKNPTKPLYLMCVCDKGSVQVDGGYRLFDIFARELALRGVNPEDFSKRLLVSTRHMNMTDAEVGVFYKVADCGVSCADGEGFGLCAFEHMGMGVPQVLSDVIGHREYCRSDNSILVKPTFRAYNPTGLSVFGGQVDLVDYRDMSKAMERYVLSDELRLAHGLQASKTVATYAWSRVMKGVIKRLDLIRQERLIDEESC